MDAVKEGMKELGLREHRSELEKVDPQWQLSGGEEEGSHITSYT